MTNSDYHFRISPSNNISFFFDDDDDDDDDIKKSLDESNDDDYMDQNIGEKDDIVFGIDENGLIRIAYKEFSPFTIDLSTLAYKQVGYAPLTFNHYSEILKEFEDLINDPSVKEKDLQYFLEQYPKILTPVEGASIIPQPVLHFSNTELWRPDFVVSPTDEDDFKKIIELKLPKEGIYKKTKNHHKKFTASFMDAIFQLKDYGRAFEREETRLKFEKKYGITMFKPDLEIIIGRKWNYDKRENMMMFQREEGIKVLSWDNLLELAKNKLT